MAVINKNENNISNSLHEAILQGDVEAIRDLLQSFEHDPAALEKIIETQDEDGHNALHLAALNGQHQVIPVNQTF